MTRTVTIVGAGPGGLASAMLLARAGLRVRILERLETPGGRTSSLESGTGFRFDLGQHFFSTHVFCRIFFLRAAMTSITK